MNLVKYNKEQHYLKILEWFVLRNMMPIEPDYLPDTGYVVDNKAAMFLCTTNSKICFFEYFIADPKTTKEEKVKYTEILVNKLLEDAKSLNFKKVINYIDKPTVINNLKNLGFYEYIPNNKISCLVKDVI